MLQENEIITFVLGVGVLIFILINRSQLECLPSPRILLVGFYILFGGWVLTILEAFFLKGFLNVIEHGCYVGSAILVTVWCWKVFGKKECRR